MNNTIHQEHPLSYTLLKILKALVHFCYLSSKKKRKKINTYTKNNSITIVCTPSPSPGTCLLANADDFDAVLLSAPAVAVAEEQQETAREVERGLLDLQQVFLDKALVEARGRRGRGGG